MELQASRCARASAPAGEPVLLLDQDRARWDRLLIAPRPGGARARRARSAAQLGPYALQAAIAACHARARTADETDWRAIAALYAALAALAPSPVVELNRAVAVGDGVRPGGRARARRRALPASRALARLPPAAERARRPARAARPPRRGAREFERAASLTAQRARARAAARTRRRVRVGAGGGRGRHGPRSPARLTCSRHHCSGHVTNAHLPELRDRQPRRRPVLHVLRFRARAKLSGLRHAGPSGGSLLHVLRRRGRCRCELARCTRRSSPAGGWRHLRRGCARRPSARSRGRLEQGGAAHRDRAVRRPVRAIPRSPSAWTPRR